MMNKTFKIVAAYSISTIVASMFITTTNTINVIGVLVGVLGISVAVYLQMITPRHVPVVYTTAFYAVGSLLLMLHIDAVGGINREEIVFIQLSAVIGALTFELYGLHWIATNTETKEYDTIKLIEEVFYDLMK